MKALRFTRTGSLDALELVDLPMPEPAAGEALVQVQAAALHPSDVKNVLGNFRHTTLPRVPGRDGAGVVVTGSAPWQGRAVWFSASGLGFTRDGTHADFVCVPEAALGTKPESLSFAQAARCGVPYITVLDAFDRVALAAGERLLVIGAGGAVGQVAVQLAQLRGVQVIAAPEGGSTELPVLDLYRRAGTLIGVNSLLNDDRRCAGWLGQLAKDFDAGALTPPEEPEGATLERAAEAYAALRSGQRRGQVIVPE